MATNAIIPEAINDFNMYISGNKLVGITGEVSLAELSNITQEISGVGVLGTFETAIIGFFEHASQEIPFRMLNEDLVGMYTPDKMLDVTLRAAQQSTVKATGEIDFTGMRIVFRGRAEKLALGTVKQGGQTDSSVTIGIIYELIEISGKKLFELDKINGIFRVNGVDMLARIKALT